MHLLWNPPYSLWINVCGFNGSTLTFFPCPFVKDMNSDEMCNKPTYIYMTLRPHPQTSFHYP